MEALLNPLFFWPTLFGFVAGWIVAARVQAASGRVLFALVLPMAVAVVALAPHQLFGPIGETHGFAMIALAFLVLCGWTACGLGLVCGHFTRRPKRTPPTT